MNRKPNLAAEIEAAFTGNIYPGDELLTVYDPAGREYDSTWQLLRGRDWRQMPVAEFLRGDTPIPDLTADAFHYFLPGLLLASLGDDDVAPEVASSLEFFLSPENVRADGEFAYDNTPRYERTMSLLSPRQREAVIRVLENYVARGWSSPDNIRSTVDRLRLVEDAP